jgi:hypothetical protein
LRGHRSKPQAPRPTKADEYASGSSVRITPAKAAKSRPKNPSNPTRGMIAPFVLDGPINRLAFETYVERVLTPELREGDVVVMDNLSSHKGQKVRERIKAAGAGLLYLPPYSPDFNPIENAFAKLKPCCAKLAAGRPPRASARQWTI